MKRIVAPLLICLALLSPRDSDAGWLPLGKASGGGGGWCTLIPQTGLTNCWPFDTANTTTGTATDVIGGKNATLTSVTLLGSGPSSNLNNAGVFNGTSSTGTTTLANVPASAFSLVIWLKPNTTGTNARPIANCHTDSDNNGFQLLNSSTWTLDVGNGTTFIAVATNTSSTAWQMVTYTYDGTTLKNYVGSTLGTNSGTLTGPVTGCATNVAFGFNPAYSGDFFAGDEGGTAMYSSALTAGNVSTINALTIVFVKILSWVGRWGLWPDSNQVATINGL